MKRLFLLVCSLLWIFNGSTIFSMEKSAPNQDSNDKSHNLIPLDQPSQENLENLKRIAKHVVPFGDDVSFLEDAFKKATLMLRDKAQLYIGLKELLKTLIEIRLDLIRHIEPHYVSEKAVIRALEDELTRSVSTKSYQAPLPSGHSHTISDEELNKIVGELMQEWEIGAEKIVQAITLDLGPSSDPIATIASEEPEKKEPKPSQPAQSDTEERPEIVESSRAFVPDSFQDLRYDESMQPESQSNLLRRTVPLLAPLAIWAILMRLPDDMGNNILYKFAALTRQNVTGCERNGILLNAFINLQMLTFTVFSLLSPTKSLFDRTIKFLLPVTLWALLRNDWLCEPMFLANRFPALASFLLVRPYNIAESGGTLYTFLAAGINLGYESLKSLSGQRNRRNLLSINYDISGKALWQ